MLQLASEPIHWNFAVSLLPLYNIQNSFTIYLPVFCKSAIVTTKGMHMKGLISIDHIIGLVCAQQQYKIWRQVRVSGAEFSGGYYSMGEVVYDAGSLASLTSLESVF